MCLTCGRIKSLLAFNAPFVPLDSPTTQGRVLQAKAVYFLMQLLVMAMGVYKVWVMGLLPTSGSDFLAWKSERPVPTSSPPAINVVDDGIQCCLNSGNRHIAVHVEE